MFLFAFFLFCASGSLFHPGDKIFPQVSAIKKQTDTCTYANSGRLHRPTAQDWVKNIGANVKILQHFLLLRSLAPVLARREQQSSFQLSSTFALTKDN